MSLLHGWFGVAAAAALVALPSLAWSADEDPLPDFGMGPVQFVDGSDCTQDNTEVVLTEDKRTMSLIFKDGWFRAEAGTTGYRGGYKHCRIRFSFKVPAGYSLNVITADHQGSVLLFGRSYARLYGRTGFLKSNGRLDPRRSRVMVKVWRTRADDLFNDIYPGFDDLPVRNQLSRKLRSRCGGTATLEVFTSALVLTNRHLEQAELSVGSMDILTTSSRAVGRRRSRSLAGEAPDSLEGRARNLGLELRRCR